ncbi:MAG: tetratricopeptide repeat protein [Candidatus Omnitrophota bacterium]
MIPLSLKPANRATNSHIFFILLIALVGCVLYANSLGGDFQWDDILLIKKNLNLRSQDTALTAFFRPLYTSLRYYRPLQELSYTLDYSLWKLNPIGYHLTSIGLHITNAILLYFFCYLFVGRRIPAFWAAFLFCCHPALTEPVNYISSRSDLLVAFFTLLVFIFYVKNHIFISAACFGLAFLSKESALIIPFLLLCYEGSSRKRYRNLWSFFALTVLFCGILIVVTPQKIFHPPNISYFLSMPKAFLTYLRAWLLPFGIYKTWSIAPVQSLRDPFFMFPVLGLVLFFFLVFKYRHISKIAFFGIIWFFVSLVPFIVIVYPFGLIQLFPFSFAWIYTPAMGLGLVLASCLSSNEKLNQFRKRILSICLTVVVLLFSIQTIRINTLWSGPALAFNQYIFDRLPPNSKPLFLSKLGMVYAQNNKTSQALDLFKAALATGGKDNDALADIGTIFLQEGRLDLALRCYEEALRQNPDLVPVHYNLGLLHLMNQDTEAAIQEFEKTAELDPTHADAHYNLTILYARKNDTERASEEYEKTIRLDPQAFREIQ